MKELLLLRHAKSSWTDPAADDHDRPLNSRGKRDAPRMGRLLVSEDLRPDRIVSSTARRARKTAKATARACDYHGDIAKVEGLYHASPEQILRIVRGTDNAIGRLLLVGHNPGLEALAEELSATICRLPTAALAHFKLEISTWNELSPTTRVQLAALWHPKHLG